MQTNKCQICGKNFKTFPCKKAKACSVECRHKYQSKVMFGRIKAKEGDRTIPGKLGYARIYTSKGHVRENRYVVEKFIGRKLKSSEIVHHIDGDKENNDIKNLKIMSRGEHIGLHNRTRKHCNTDV